MPVFSISSRLVSPQLCFELSMKFCALRPFAPPLAADTDRANGYAVSSLKFWVIGWAG